MLTWPFVIFQDSLYFLFLLCPSWKILVKHRLPNHYGLMWIHFNSDPILLRIIQKWRPTNLSLSLNILYSGINKCPRHFIQIRDHTNLLKNIFKANQAFVILICFIVQWMNEWMNEFIKKNFKSEWGPLRINIICVNLWMTMNSFLSLFLIIYLYYLFSFTCIICLF